MPTARNDEEPMRRDFEVAAATCAPMNGYFSPLVCATVAYERADRLARVYNSLRRSKDKGTYQPGERGWRSDCPEFAYYLEAYWANTDCLGVTKRETEAYFDAHSGRNPISNNPIHLTIWGLDVPPLVQGLQRMSLLRTEPRFLTLIGVYDLMWRRAFCGRLRDDPKTTIELHDIRTTSIEVALSTLEAELLGKQSIAKSDRSVVSYCPVTKRAVYATPREQAEVKACIHVLSHLSLFCIELLVEFDVPYGIADSVWSKLIRGRFMVAALELAQPGHGTRPPGRTPESDEAASRMLDASLEGLSEAEDACQGIITATPLPEGASRFDLLADLAVYLLGRIEAGGHVAPDVGMLRLCSGSLQQGFARGGVPAAEGVKGLKYCKAPAFRWHPKANVSRLGKAAPAQSCLKCQGVNHTGSAREAKRRNRQRKAGTHAHRGEQIDYHVGPITDYLQARGVPKEVLEDVLSEFKDESAS